METIIKQQQKISFRAVTISDMNTIVKLYQQQKATLDSALTNHFGLPFYVAEIDRKIVGYSYATPTNANNYHLNTHIDTNFSNNQIDESLIRESELFFKNEWQNSHYKNLSISIAHLVNWLNNSNS
ncbi:GNAT family N-acetyltransferase [Flavobacterium undicola]|uniref:hypothetical protein n=1 Tax=Flavobacterium undicola TaxID=1932779 RepID=UPI001376FA71|nr:hypothetical protein [Flavobacterium undicola]MBA0884002.1 hypothetical protein [Flavobacterium undicola]